MQYITRFHYLLIIIFSAKTCKKLVYTITKVDQQRTSSIINASESDTRIHTSIALLDTKLGMIRIMYVQTLPLLESKVA